MNTTKQTTIIGSQDIPITNINDTTKPIELIYQLAKIPLEAVNRKQRRGNKEKTRKHHK
jgi:hypothetical protein